MVVKLRTYILLLFWLFCGLSVYSADNIDQTGTDTLSILSYNTTARDLIYGANPDYEKAFYYATEGLVAAKKASYLRGEAELNRTIGTIYFYNRRYDDAIKSYQLALEQCLQLRDQDGVAQNYYNKGIVYMAQSNLYYALDNYLNALNIWEQRGNLERTLDAYRDIIQLYWQVQKYSTAVDYITRALQVAKDLGNKREEASLYDILALIYVAMGDFWETEKYYNQSIELYNQLGDRLQVARITQNMAVNLYMNEFPIALRLLKESAAMYEAVDAKNTTLYTIYNNIGSIYTADDKPDSALMYKEKALQMAIRSGDSATVSNAYAVMGKFYLEDNQLDKAARYYTSILDLVPSDLERLRSEALFRLSTINYQQGKYQKAIEYLQRYRVEKDSLNVEESKKNISKLSVQYEFEKAQKEQSDLLRMNLQQQEGAIKQQRIVTILASIALFITILLLIFIIFSSLRINQSNEELKDQQDEMLRVNNQLKETYQELSMYKDHLEDMVKEQMEKLGEGENQLLTLSDNLPGGCIYRKVVYPDGRDITTYVSNTAQEWLGIKAEDIIANANVFYDRINPEDLKKKWELEKKSAAHISSYSFEYRYRKDNQEMWLLENAMPHMGENRTVIWDGIIVNITELKRFEKELIDARMRAEQSDMLKSAFLANTSHEIRTPMNGIIGFLNFIKQDNLPAEKQHAYINVIKNNVQQLLQIIEDIVDISKIDSRQLSIHSRPFDLNNLVNELRIFFHDFIVRKDKRIEIILDDSQNIHPSMIISDASRIRQVLSNLIGNAVKFTHKGYIRFGYQLTEDRSELLFFVEDTGIGISLENQQQIFNRFSQVYDETKQSIYGGTGLGLAICKNLVEMMGGRIWINSAPNVGSTFYFTLPFNPIEEQVAS